MIKALPGYMRAQASIQGEHHEATESVHGRGAAGAVRRAERHRRGGEGDDHLDQADQERRVKRSDIGRNAIDGTRVANGALVPGRAERGRAGARSRRRARRRWRRSAPPGPQNIKANTAAPVATLSNIPPGAYAIFAKTTLTAANDSTTFPPDNGQSLGGHCVLDVSGDADESRTLLGSPGSNSPGSINTQITHTYDNTGRRR